ncbi:hypothetical protein OG342_07050 [Streptomyces bobili]|uniref:hypothetical protein n=1 Tax=Streptomyces bobili TaxID=67280 RepID=UPI0022504C4A|nr:hypothetical protein [Streptomyces bobili]MCX5522621.1 hypothetical protein [Streptomyces bobili]
MTEPTTGYCPHCGRGDVAPTPEAYEQQRQRAEQAEAAIARARHLHRPVGVVAAAEAGIEPDCATCGPNRWPCPTYTALDQPAPAAAEATDNQEQ